MALTTLDKGKGETVSEANGELSESDSTSPVSSSESDTGSDSDGGDEITPEYLESLLDQARQNAAASCSIVRPTNNNDTQEEDIIELAGPTNE